MLVKPTAPCADIAERFSAFGGAIPVGPLPAARPGSRPPGDSGAVPPDNAPFHAVPGAESAESVGDVDLAGGTKQLGRRLLGLDPRREQAAQHGLISVVGTYKDLPAVPVLGNESARTLGAFAPAMANGACVALHVAATGAGADVSAVAWELAVAASRLPACKSLFLETRKPDAKEGRLASGSRAGAELPNLGNAYRTSGKAEVAEISTQFGSFHAAALAADPALCPADAPRCSLTGLYESLQRSYDLILIDCPPVPDLTELLRVVPGTPWVLLVVAAGRTRATEAVRARVLVERMGGQLVGAVMSQAAKRRWIALPRFISPRS